MLKQMSFLKLFSNRMSTACTLTSDNSLMWGFECVNGDALHLCMLGKHKMNWALFPLFREY